MRAALLVLLALLVATPRLVLADDKAEAKKAFKRAEAAEQRKDWRTAIAEYQLAYDLAPHPDVLYNIALDFERLEEYRDAATYYRRYLDDSPDAEDTARVEKLIKTLRNRPGTVTITSEPDGAEVLIDGKRRGVTPLEVSLAGAHKIEVAGPSSSEDRDVTVEFGEPQTVHVVLVARTGTLVVTSNVEGAQVVVDGNLVGVTPASVPLPAGAHRLVVMADGWATHERPVDIPAEGSTQVTANLVRPLGYVEPPKEPTDPKYYFGITGGADGRGEAGGLGLLSFGVHKGLLSIGGGYGYAGGTVAYGVEMRVAFTRSIVRPYVKAIGMIGGMTFASASAGLLAAFRVAPPSRLETVIFVEGGGGIGRLVDDDDPDLDAEKLVFIPVLAGVQISY
jgi:hypothetical protein